MYKTIKFVAFVLIKILVLLLVMYELFPNA